MTTYEGLYYYDNMGEISWVEFEEGLKEIREPMELYHKIKNKIEVEKKPICYHGRRYY